MSHQKMNATRYVLLGLVAIGITLLSVDATHAARIIQTPADIGLYKKGESFNVRYAIYPDDGAIYTAKIELRYPPNLMRLNSFQLEKPWIALVQSGYDTVDAKNGILIKTAGYPKGIRQPTNFGTAAFTMLGNASGTIRIAPASMLFDGKNRNTFIDQKKDTVAYLKNEQKVPQEQSGENQEIRQDEAPLITTKKEEESKAAPLPILFDVSINSLKNASPFNTIVFVSIFILLVSLLILITLLRRSFKRKKTIPRH